MPIGALPAARGEARARMEGRASTLDVAWVAHKGSIYRVIGVSPSENGAVERAAILRTIDTFRPLTKADRARIRVERIRIRTGRAGETMAAVAARTGSAWNGPDLEVLNGLAPGEPLSATRAVKVVLEERY